MRHREGRKEPEGLLFIVSRTTPNAALGPYLLVDSSEVCRTKSRDGRKRVACTSGNPLPVIQSGKAKIQARASPLTLETWPRELRGCLPDRPNRRSCARLSEALRSATVEDPKRQERIGTISWRAPSPTWGHAIRTCLQPAVSLERATRYCFHLFKDQYAGSGFQASRGLD